MKTRFAICFLLAVLAVGCKKKYNFPNYGVYVSDGSSFIELKKYRQGDYDSRLLDFKNPNSIPSIAKLSQIVIYSKAFNSAAEFVFYRIDSIHRRIRNGKVAFWVRRFYLPKRIAVTNYQLKGKPLNKKDAYLLIPNKETPSGVYVLRWGFKSVYLFSIKGKGKGKTKKMVKAKKSDTFKEPDQGLSISFDDHIAFEKRMRMRRISKNKTKKRLRKKRSRKMLSQKVGSTNKILPRGKGIPNKLSGIPLLASTNLIRALSRKFRYRLSKTTRGRCSSTIRTYRVSRNIFTVITLYKNRVSKITRKYLGRARIALVGWNNYSQFIKKSQLKYRSNGKYYKINSYTGHFRFSDGTKTLFLNLYKYKKKAITRYVTGYTLFNNTYEQRRISCK